jgi:hypothetical protein
MLAHNEEGNKPEENQNQELPSDCNVTQLYQIKKIFY